jgi:hypothetical protein
MIYLGVRVNTLTPSGRPGVKSISYREVETDRGREYHIFLGRQRYAACSTPEQLEDFLRDARTIYRARL